MEYRLLGWPDDGVTLRLDHRRFAYAGKFVMSSTGKAVVVADDEHASLPDDREGYASGVLAAAAFNEDRTDGALWIRYLTARADRRGEGLGSRLAAFVVSRARERGYATVRIAVNNVYSYEALAKAGFGFTGRETGLAELVLEHPAPGDTARYREGIDRFLTRDLPDAERSFARERRARGAPVVVDAPGE